ncbi:MAG: hypothetical protein HWN68_15950 [Desulfobacterales bacterium]|nr:hypothetical protein [Desulfobacterales bacterium]
MITIYRETFGDIDIDLLRCEILTRVSMGGRFGKYGDAKRKAKIRTNRRKRRNPA